MSRDNFWFTRVVGIRIRNEASPDPEMGPGIAALPMGPGKNAFRKAISEKRTQFKNYMQICEGAGR
jgi:hypothetical protein